MFVVISAIDSCWHLSASFSGRLAKNIPCICGITTLLAVWRHRTSNLDGVLVVDFVGWDSLLAM